MVQRNLVLWRKHTDWCVSEPLLLQGNLNQYNSIHHILWCIENILLKAKEDKSLLSSKC